MECPVHWLYRVYHPRTHTGDPMFKVGETAVMTVRDHDGSVFGTQHAEVIGAVMDVPGQVRVRPFHSDDVVIVSIHDLAKLGA